MKKPSFFLSLVKIFKVSRVDSFSVVHKNIQNIPHSSLAINGELPADDKLWIESPIRVDCDSNDLEVRISNEDGQSASFPWPQKK